jgi:hypothetical protein
MKSGQWAMGNGRRCLLGFCILLAACAGAAGTSTGGDGQSAPRRGGSLRAQDRIVIPSMTTVSAIAMSEQYVFVATPRALAIHDSRFGGWLPPLSRIDGWPDLPIDVMMADPADPAAVWFASGTYVYHYRVGLDDLVRAIVPQRVSPNAFYVDGGDPAAGVIVGGSGAGFVRVSPTGFVQPYNPTLGRPPGARIAPQTAASVFARYRSLQDFQRVLTRDESLRSWPISSAASHPLKGEVWLGTLGGGVFRVDPNFARSEQVPFGLLGDGAGAVARAADGVWFGSVGGASGREGLTFVDTELRQWRWIDGGPGSPLVNARIAAVAVWESTLWVATDRGLMHVDGRSGTLIRRWDDLSGLPNNLVHAVAPTMKGAWAATARGLVFAHAPQGARGGRNEDADSLMISTTAVRALVTRGDTLWIGSAQGLLILVPGAREPRRVGAGIDARLATPVTAIATADSVVAFATANDEVVRVHTRTGAVIDAGPFTEAGRVGRVNALAMDANTVWIAGDRGVVVVRRDTRAQRALVVGRDIPSEAYGIVLTPQYAWIATRDGGVRVTRLSDGMIR